VCRYDFFFVQILTYPALQAFLHLPLSRNLKGRSRMILTSAPTLESDRLILRSPETRIGIFTTLFSVYFIARLFTSIYVSKNKDKEKLI